jgi:hypothetical protein
MFWPVRGRARSLYSLEPQREKYIKGRKHKKEFRQDYKDELDAAQRDDNLVMP